MPLEKLGSLHTNPLADGSGPEPQAREEQLSPTTQVRREVQAACCGGWPVLPGSLQMPVQMRQCQEGGLPAVRVLRTSAIGCQAPHSPLQSLCDVTR